MQEEAYYQSLQAASLRPQNAREALESIANAAWDQERSILHHLQTSFHHTKMTCLDSLAKGFVSGAVSNPDSCISSFGTCLSISSSPLNSDWLWAFTKDGKMIAAPAAKEWNWFQAPLDSSYTRDAATSSVFHRRQRRLQILSDSGRAFYHFLSITAATNLYITQLDFTETWMFQMYAASRCQMFLHPSQRRLHTYKNLQPDFPRGFYRWWNATATTVHLKSATKF